MGNEVSYLPDQHQKTAHQSQHCQERNRCSRDNFRGDTKTRGRSAAAKSVKPPDQWRKESNERPFLVVSPASDISNPSQFLHRINNSNKKKPLQKQLIATPAKCVRDRRRTSKVVVVQDDALLADKSLQERLNALSECDQRQNGKLKKHRQRSHSLPPPTSFYFPPAELTLKQSRSRDSSEHVAMAGRPVTRSMHREMKETEKTQTAALTLRAKAIRAKRVFSACWEDCRRHARTREDPRSDDHNHVALESGCRSPLQLDQCCDISSQIKATKRARKKERVSEETSSSNSCSAKENGDGNHGPKPYMQFAPEVEAVQLPVGSKRGEILHPETKETQTLLGKHEKYLHSQEEYLDRILAVAVQDKNSSTPNATQPRMVDRNDLNTESDMVSPVAALFEKKKGPQTTPLGVDNAALDNSSNSPYDEVFINDSPGARQPEGVRHQMFSTMGDHPSKKKQDLEGGCSLGGVQTDSRTCQEPTAEISASHGSASENEGTPSERRRQVQQETRSTDKLKKNHCVEGTGSKVDPPAKNSSKARRRKKKAHKTYKAKTRTAAESAVQIVTSDDRRMKSKNNSMESGRSEDSQGTRTNDDVGACGGQRNIRDGNVSKTSDVEECTAAKVDPPAWSTKSRHRRESGNRIGRVSGSRTGDQNDCGTTSGSNGSRAQPIGSSLSGTRRRDAAGRHRRQDDPDGQAPGDRFHPKAKNGIIDPKSCEEERRTRPHRSKAPQVSRRRERSSSPLPKKSSSYLLRKTCSDVSDVRIGFKQKREAAASKHDVVRESFEDERHAHSRAEKTVEVSFGKQLDPEPTDKAIGVTHKVDKDLAANSKTSTKTDHQAPTVGTLQHQHFPIPEVDEPLDKTSVLTGNTEHNEQSIDSGIGAGIEPKSYHCDYQRYKRASSIEPDESEVFSGQDISAEKRNAVKAEPIQKQEKSIDDTPPDHDDSGSGTLVATMATRTAVEMLQQTYSLASISADASRQPKPRKIKTEKADDYRSIALGNIESPKNFLGGDQTEDPSPSALSIDSQQSRSSAPMVSEQAVCNAAFLFSCSYEGSTNGDGQPRAIINKGSDIISDCQSHDSSLSSRASCSITTLDSRNRVSNVSALSKPITIPASSTLSIDECSKASSRRVRFSDANEVISSCHESHSVTVNLETEPQPRDIFIPAIETKLSDLTEITVPRGKSMSDGKRTSDASSASKRVGPVLEDSPTEEHHDIPANDPETEENCGEKDGGSKESGNMNWSYCSEDGLVEGVTPLRRGKSGLQTTNEPYLRFKKAKEKFSSKDSSSISDASLTSKRVGPVLEDSPTEEHHDIPANDPETEENCGEKDCGSKECVNMNWSYCSEDGLGEGVTPLRSGKSGLQTTNEPYLRFKEAKEKFSSKDSSGASQKGSQPVKRAVGGVVSSRIAQMEQATKAACRKPRRATTGYNALAPRKSTLVSTIFQKKATESGLLGQDKQSALDGTLMRNNTVALEKESQQYTIQKNDGVDTSMSQSEEIKATDSPNNWRGSEGSSQEAADDAFGAFMHPTTEMLSDSSIRRRSTVGTKTDEDDEDDFAKILNYRDSMESEFSTDQETVSTVRQVKGNGGFLLDAKYSTYRDSDGGAETSTTRSSSSSRSYGAGIPTVPRDRSSIVSTGESTTMSSLIEKEEAILTFREEAPVKPNEQNPRAVPGKLCLSPMQKSPMQPLTWRALAAAAQKKDSQKFRAKNQSLSERDPNVNAYYSDTETWNQS